MVPETCLRVRRCLREEDGLTTEQRRAQQEREREAAREAVLINSPHRFISQLFNGPTTHDLGPMNHVYEFYGALHFIEEQTKADKLFEKCCKRGDAVLENIQTPPAEI